MKIGACVYLMRCYENGLYKIGYTTQMPEKRKRQIESPSGNPFKQSIRLRVISIILCQHLDVAKYIEGWLLSQGHEELVHAAGDEWFHEPSWVMRSILRENNTGKPWGWRDVTKLMEALIHDREMSLETLAAMGRQEVARLTAQVDELSGVA